MQLTVYAHYTYSDVDIMNYVNFMPTLFKLTQTIQIYLLFLDVTSIVLMFKRYIVRVYIQIKT